MESAERCELMKRLVPQLLDERGQRIPQARIDSLSEAELWSTFRALVNERQPIAASADFLRDQDALLKSMIAEKGIAYPSDAERSPVDPRIGLWQGDITTMAADAIVNAANSQMLGCWRAGHHCIDNAIHTFAGVQLRLECARIMVAQGHEEPTGAAKITRAYNLPAKHVIHTVGPIANGAPTQLHRRQLASCYTSCLDLAAENDCRSIAFCCISTGVFGFPKDQAAQIAVETVSRWLADRPNCTMTVVFNVFSPEDESIYRKLLALLS